MKKNNQNYLLFILSLFFSIQISAQQNPLLTLPEGFYYNNTLGFLPSYNLNHPNADYGGELSDFAHNAMYDVNDSLLFFIVDGKIYNGEGKILNDLANHGPNLRGFSEVVVIPMPGNCSKYYIVAYSLSPAHIATHNMKPYLAILNMSRVNVSDPNLMGDLDDIYSSKILDLSSFISGWSNVPKYGGGYLAASKLRNDNSRYLFVARSESIYTFKLLGSSGVIPGVTLENSYTIPCAQPSSRVRGEMEVVEVMINETQKRYRLAVPYDKGSLQSSDEICNGQMGAFLADFDYNNMNVISGSEKILDLNVHSSLNLSNPENNPYCYGLEFTDNGDYLYMSVNKRGILYHDCTSPVLTVNKLNINSSLHNDFSKTHIELDINGNMIFAANNKLGRLTNPNIPAWAGSNFNGNYLTTNYGISSVTLPSSNGYYSQVACYTLPDQIDGMNYKDHFFASVECCKDNSEYDADVYIVENGGTWTNGNNPFNNTSNPVRIKNELVIRPGVDLKINGMIFEFAPNAKVVVERGDYSNYGAKLELNNTKFTKNSTVCGLNDLWQGVEVEGYPHESQNPIYATQQAKFIVRKNSIIEHAGYAAMNSKLSDIFNYSGGIIRSFESNFYDNFMGIFLFEYQNFNPSNGHIMPNASFVQNSNFITTSNNTFINHYLPLGISLYKADLRVLGSNFENQNPHITNLGMRGYGIYSFDSKLSVEQFPNFSSYNISQFHNLDCGVAHYALDKTKTLNVKWSHFYDNMVGVYNLNSDNSEIINNYFQLLNHDESIGLYLSNSTGYTVEENEFFTDMFEEIDNHGIIVQNSGEYRNIIRRNYFETLGNGIKAQHINATDDYSYQNLHVRNHEGLNMRCNSFLEIMNNDLSNVGQRLGRIAYGQGSSNTPAGNVFSHATHYFDHYSYYQDGQEDMDIVYTHHDPSISSYLVEPANYYVNSNLNPDFSLNTGNQGLTEFDEQCPVRVNTFPYSFIDRVILNIRPIRFKLQSDLSELLDYLDMGSNISLVDEPIHEKYIAHASEYNQYHIEDLIQNETPRYLSKKTLFTWLADEDLKVHLENNSQELFDLLIFTGHADEETVAYLQSLGYSTTITDDIQFDVMIKNQAEIALAKEKYHTFFNEINELKSEIAYYETEEIRYFMEDTTGTYDLYEEIKEIMEEEHSQINEVYQSFVYANLSDYTSANNLVQNISDNRLRDFYELSMTIHENGGLLSYIEIDSTVIGAFENLSEIGDFYESRSRELATSVIKYIEKGNLVPIIVRTQKSNKKEVDSNQGSENISESEELFIDKNTIKVYPNPATNNLMVSYDLSENDNMLLQIYDFMGREIKSQNLRELQNTVNIDISDLANGNYMLRISDNGKVLLSDKIIVKR